MDTQWSKKQAQDGCTNCWSKPEQVAVISLGGTIIRPCFDCLSTLHGESLLLIDNYDYDDDEADY